MVRQYTPKQLRVLPLEVENKPLHLVPDSVLPTFLAGMK
jgi:hypothetical protein